MITHRSLIFGIGELIKVIPEPDVPPDLYREIYSLANRKDDANEERIERAISVLRTVLANFETSLECPDCKNFLPQCEVCLFCGHYFLPQKFDASSPTLKAFTPFKEGSQREIVEKAIRMGTPVEEIVKQVRAKYPGVQESTVVNNMYIYLSTWRKQFGWTIVRENGIIKLEDTHGNG